MGKGHARLPIEIGRRREAAEVTSLITEPGIAGSGRERYAEVRREQTTRHVEAHPGRHVLAPGARVRDIRRIGVAAGNADRLADVSVAADGRLPIVNAVGLAGKLLSGIGEIGHAEIEIDICDLGAETAADSELGGWLGRQLDAGGCGAGIKLTKPYLDRSPGCGPMIGQRRPAINVIGCKPRSGAEV